MTDIVKYETPTGAAIELSPQIVRQYLVSGGGNISDQEVYMFLKLCQMQRLNPFLREAYLIKYGTQKAQMVTAIESFRKRADRNNNFDGHEVGIKIWSATEKTAFCKVHRKDRKVPVYVEVDYDEYVGKTKDGNVTKMWKEKPKTMLKKVAEAQGLRTAFPEDLGGMYTMDEINTVDQDKLPTDKVDTPEEKTERAKIRAKITALMKEHKLSTDELIERTDKIISVQKFKTDEDGKCENVEDLVEMYELLKAELEKTAPDPETAEFEDVPDEQPEDPDANFDNRVMERIYDSLDAMELEQSLEEAKRIAKTYKIDCRTKSWATDLLAHLKSDDKVPPHEPAQEQLL